jgi:hypothetical protein
MTYTLHEPNCGRLHALLWHVGSRLQRLGPQPAALACATDKFNDANRDDFWCAVRVGEYFWEQSQFFGRFASEKAHGPTDEGGEGSAMLQSHTFDAARAMLDELERAEWRNSAEKEFGQRSNGQVFALVHQLDQLWLHISHPMDAYGELYAILRDRIVHFGEVDDRMDDLIGKPNLLLSVREIAVKALPLVSHAARRHFHPQLANMSASLELWGLLASTAESIRLVTPEVVVIRLRAATYDERRQGCTWSTYFGPDFWVRDVHYTSRSYKDVLTRPMKEEVRERSLARFQIADFKKLETIIQATDQAYARGLFEAAFETETFGNEDLLFAIVEDQLYLLHDTRLFQVNKTAMLGASGSTPFSFVGYARVDRIGLASHAPFRDFNIDDPDCVTVIDS